ncbi:MAG: Cell wall alpha-1,3-glucan synthase ags1 [Vezdaea aestivalis]|nr:MAG: Cell wall alpha-1,3-glucan synthase ags1 [Vezdaea aestivalis]
MSFLRAMVPALAVFFSFCFRLTDGLRYHPDEADWNLNQNQNTINPLEYWGEWENHTYNPSPANWRFPFYTIFLDKFVNGDPTNDDANGTYFEHDIMGNQLRHGGDLQGFIDALDYIQGMGIKALYIAGSPHINFPWGADAYSPLDLTLLDHHFGTIKDWRNAVDEVHRRGMYIVLDNTMATMGDLVGFEGFLNETTPFTTSEHRSLWKKDRRYHDFAISNDYNKTCEYPRFWLETGSRVGQDVLDQLSGCYNSEVDQYGDREAFGVYPDWQRQLTKFASVQDRLREWHLPVRQKIQLFSCITIAMLDIDGFRMDKAVQVTVDAQSEWSDYIRQCARRFGKENFFIPGEITGGNTFGSIYLGRGKEPQMASDTLLAATSLANYSDDSLYIRPKGKQALDAGAFHYTFYRSLTRFLGMDGNLASGYDAPLNWVNAWNTMLLTNDFANPNTGEFDPRHMWGVTNQDVFRWPAITMGTQRMLLGMFLSTLHMPGIPLLLWGEEQAFYVLDNTADNYIFGRQAMSTALAWQTHGCYHLDSDQYYQFPVDKAKRGCSDDWNSLDHRDPSAPVRNILKTMYYFREQYPVLTDGFFLQELSNHTRPVQMPGSDGIITVTGLWSTIRGRLGQTQNLGFGNQSVWLVYQNENTTVQYNFNCSNNDSAIVAPFDAGTTVKNLFFPHEELTLGVGPKTLGFEGSKIPNGCLKSLTIDPYGFKAFVPIGAFVPPPPVITTFEPGYDARVLSSWGPGQNGSVNFAFYFSVRMSCDAVRNSLQIFSTTESRVQAGIDRDSIVCANVEPVGNPKYVSGNPTAWKFSAKLVNVTDGLHAIAVHNATTGDLKRFTNSVDRFMFRVGQLDNPMVFTKSANYTQGVLNRDSTGTLVATHKAAGADKFRYSLNFGTSYSAWQDYKGGNFSVGPRVWSGTKLQDWESEHIILQYWSRLAGSSDHVQHADLNWQGKPPRRFPHVFLQGPFNAYGYDAGVTNEMHQDKNGQWSINFMSEWPAKFQFNVWGVNPDGQADQTMVFGDANGDSIIDRMPPSALGETIVNITAKPVFPYLSYRIFLHDGSYRFLVIPAGSQLYQVGLFIVLALFPLITGILATSVFGGAFYKVKWNKLGFTDTPKALPLVLRNKFRKLRGTETPPLKEKRPASYIAPDSSAGDQSTIARDQSTIAQDQSTIAVPQINRPPKRKCVLIATMEYDIEDWEIKVKIGGLGVMAQLMGKNLGHQDLIWVIPCVGGIDYPVDTPSEPMNVTILGSKYEVQVQTHVLKNITFVLLDAPVFRQQTKAEPYPPRMDDLDSAIYYSAWNQCIAFAIKRYSIDLYHINDYHGAVAPLHLLPHTVPCCFSLHNAEFQGLWPMRTGAECAEVCRVYNLDISLVEQYVQFGNVFNLLHAGSSYLRIHQRGFGAVGVSRKYGKRAFSRYPIFWGLDKVGHLANPDPTDLAEWDGKAPKAEDVVVDPAFEHARIELKRQAQEWANLDQNPDADLLVFVGRWSMQKGIDLIADVMPAILEENKNVQLVCVGPVIDLYGKFAALKLGRMMELYPGRVYSKPEFTALPPCIFSGADFALIPSRDEPFGLVAVEFGRKGALGIGARVGGLGSMPGWWFTIESITTSHVINQFKSAVKAGLASKSDVRARMRARSAKQRFPVAHWVQQLEALQSRAIKIHHKEARIAQSRGRSRIPSHSGTPSGASTPAGMVTPGGSTRHLGYRLSEAFATMSRSPSRDRSSAPSGGVVEVKADPVVSLGFSVGPGHAADTGETSSSSSSGPSLSDVPGIAVTADEQIRPEDAQAPPSEVVITREEAEATGMMQAVEHQKRNRRPTLPLVAQDTPPISTPSSVVDLSLLAQTTPAGSEGQRGNRVSFAARPESMLSVGEVVKERTDFQLQRVDPFFTDSTGEFYEIFTKKLEKLSGKTSEEEHCIEEFLMKSEKKWFNRFKDAKLGIHYNSSANSSKTNLNARNRNSFFGGRSISGSTASTAVNSGSNTAAHTPNGSTHNVYFEHVDPEEMVEERKPSPVDEFALGKDYVPPSGLRKFLSLRPFNGDWPLYSFLLAFGQIIAANSYQITLLTGEIGQTAHKLYVVASIFFIASVLWWGLYRIAKSMYVLSLPFFFYGVAFLLIGLTPWIHDYRVTGWVQNVATGFYAFGSASGSFFFGLNWGDQGGAPVKDWAYRACVIQGTQQLYVVGLWYWGSTLTKQTALGVRIVNPVTDTWKMTAICGSITFLLWLIGTILFLGLPSYYRQTPGQIPSFYRSFYKRRLTIWFFFAVIVQNFWLSAPYGRNWTFLWSSNHAKNWQIAILILVFFVGVWGACLWVFSRLSRSHSWILPIFALGLGAPRFAQILWGVSNIGLYVPWAGGNVGSALVSRGLWLWLGVLDAIAGVGIGMILLQTLTRVHIVFTLVVAQGLGSLATIIARAGAPGKVNPAPVFPDFSGGFGIALRNSPWFWVALLFNLALPFGFFVWFRKETLSKP